MCGFFWPPSSSMRHSVVERSEGARRVRFHTGRFENALEFTRGSVPVETLKPYRSNGESETECLVRIHDTHCPSTRHLCPLQRHPQLPLRPRPRRDTPVPHKPSRVVLCEVVELGAGDLSCPNHVRTEIVVGDNVKDCEIDVSGDDTTSPVRLYTTLQQTNPQRLISLDPHRKLQNLQYSLRNESKAKGKASVCQFRRRHGVAQLSRSGFHTFCHENVIPTGGSVICIRLIRVS
mmetsp:Transcript_13161/g.31089  ORF Transcript_13161/g.31089 Transcript_13161/m.31089 type:complete len:234 (+) Transcript_13161:337-1038(+)